MDDRVRDRLGELVAEHGRSLCTTPRVLSMLLRQEFANASQEIDDLEAALTHGSVAPMLAGLPELADVPDLTDKLINITGLSEERARWTIESWVAALMRERPESSGLTRDWAAWNRLDVSKQTAGGSGAFQRSVAHLLIVGVAGALGGALLGLLSLFRPGILHFDAWRDALIDLPEWAQTLSVVLMGAIGGFAGGLLGWIFGGGRSWTYVAIGGTTLGRLGFAAFFAFSFANIGVMGGLAMMGLVGAMLGSLIGAFLGSFLGLLAAERLSRFWFWP